MPNSKPSSKERAAAELELRRRRAALADLPPLSFRAFVDQVKPGYQWYTHCLRLATLLQRVADDDLPRVLVFMPPRHGKSELVSRLFPAYYVYRHPARFVGINSYAADLAYTFSRNAREHYTRLGGRLKGAASAVKHWETERGGGLWAAGVGGPITGKGFHLGIIDDPLKNAEEAASEVIRAKQKDWYASTFSTRAEPNAAIVVVQTRWHEDDLSGWLLEQEPEEPEGWHVVNFEAIKDETPRTFPASCTVEPDWREPGAALCPERYPLDRLQKLATRLGSYFWSALFQQRPSAKEGNRFKRAWFDIVPAAPAEATRVRYWDKAATAGAGDYTVGVLMARSVAGVYYVEDVQRGQWSSGERDAMLKQTAALDATRGRIAIWHEQEPGSGGKDSAEATTRMLAGYIVQSERASGDKATRAEPFAAQAEAHNIKLVAGSWTTAYLNELCEFPTGKHDDQVDASSGAFNKLALAPTATGQTLNLWKR